MATARSSIIQGPAVFEYDTGGTPVHFYTQGDIIVNWRQPTFEVPSSQFGIGSQRISDRMATISFTPSGEWESGIKSTLFPYASTKAGTSIFSGKSAIIRPLNGKPITFYDCALTKMPSLMFSGNKTLIGACEFTAISLTAQTWASANSFANIGSSGSVSDFSEFDEDAILTQPYLADWGAISGFTNMDTENGIMWEPQLTLQPKRVDSLGTIDYRFVRCDARISGIFIGPTEDQAMTVAKMEGSGSIIGRSLNVSGTAADFVVKGAVSGTTFFTAKNMVLVDFDFNYGDQNSRFPRMNFQSIRKINGAGGAYDPLFVLA